MLDVYPDVLTAKEVQEILFIGKNTAYEMLESGVIQGFKIGRVWRVTKPALLDFMHHSETVYAND